MSLPRPIRILASLLLAATLALLLGLGTTAFQHAIGMGSAEAWLMGWVLAFMVGLPVAVVMLAVAGAAQRYAPRFRIIPFAGEKIPGVGQ